MKTLYKTLCICIFAIFFGLLSGSVANSSLTGQSFSLLGEGDETDCENSGCYWDPVLNEPRCFGNSGTYCEGGVIGDGECDQYGCEEDDGECEEGDCGDDGEGGECGDADEC